MQVLRSSVRAGVATNTINLTATNITINSCRNKLFYNVLVVCQRSVTNNPLGGENAEYCALLARTNAKGKLSSVNLRKRHQRMLLRQAAKQPLHTPSSKKQSPSSSSSSRENSTISLEVVKRELESLIKRNRIYTNRRTQREKLHTRVSEKAKEMREHNAELTSQESSSNNDDDNSSINKIYNHIKTNENSVENKKKTMSDKLVHKKCNADTNRQPVMHNITQDNTKHDVSQSDILSAQTRSIINDVNHLECEEEQQELHYCSSRQYEQFEDEEQEKKKSKKNNNRGVHVNIDDNDSKEGKSENYHNNHHITSPSLLAEVKISDNSDNTESTNLIDKEITVTSIEKCDNTNSSSNNPNKSEDMTSCSDTHEYERDMEHHFAISPQCTIFGTDLDRLEYDMMREFHQCGEKMPKIDSAYSTFGANRRGRRLRWEPSSSFDMINAAATAATTSLTSSSSSNSPKNNNNNNTQCHENNKYHMSPLHMYAEAYAKEQEERAKARVHNYGSNYNKCMGINYCKGNIASRCNKVASKTRSECHSANDENDEIATSYNDRNINIDENEKEVEDDLPADANPHFPCESTSNGLELNNLHASRESNQDNKDNKEYKNSSNNNNYNECKSNTSHELNKEDLSWLYLHNNFTRAEKEIVIDGRTAFKSKLVIHNSESNNDRNNNVVFDAFYQRPAETALIKTHDFNYWHDYNHWQEFMQHSSYRDKLVENEELTEGVVDTCLPDFNLNALRKSMMKFTERFPVNEMIQESFVRIRSLRPRNGNPRINFRANLTIDNSTVIDNDNDNENSSNSSQTTSHSHTTDANHNKTSSSAIRRRREQQSILRGELLSSLSEEERMIVEQIDLNVDIPTHEARRMARRLGLDLIRFGVWYGNYKTGAHAVALCTIADYREYMREDLEFRMKKLGVNPPRTPECIEVGFRGGTLPHAIRVKAIGIAKHLLHRHAIRINLTEFGTPKEGFPILQVILDEVKRQATRLNAFHTAGIIKANYNEIFCYLYPPTGRSPKVKVSHPTPEEICNARDFYHLQNDKKIYFDGVNEQLTERERLAYEHKIDNGTAWAHFDDGLSLQRQRRLKIMLGYLPKGNKDIYAARGDVNLPQPFRTSHSTSIHNLIYPRESNIEQACRGAAVLGKRAGMHVSDMHDSGETSDNSSTLNHSYYRVEGPALEIGELKEALGLKDNRKRHIPLAPGFATLGVSTRESNKFEFGEKTK